MKLWKITPKQTSDRYDIYSGAVVAAVGELAAKNVHPALESPFTDPARAWNLGSWPHSPDGVNAEYIGEAVVGTQAGTIILTSFCAG